MALNVYQVKKCSLPEKPMMGKHIIDIISSGMYSDPLMIYREYIQNSVDSIDLAETRGYFINASPEIRVTIYPKTRTVSIYDNGVGISNDSVLSTLSNIAFSKKDVSNQRGFRGIGRLSGLAYSKEIIFETRTNEEEFVAVFKWDKTLLDEYLKENGNLDLEELFATCTEFSLREATPDEGLHFFRVTLKHISQFYDDKLLSISEITNHIAGTCPVPYKKSFEPFRTQIKEHLGFFGGFKEYPIFVNGEKVYKLYDKSIAISEKVALNIESIKFFSIPGASGEPLAKGWVAISNFPGALPKKIQMRGIRLRQGNLALGDEYYCSNFYPERRFTTWNIGEIHCSSSLIPNARRDSFELNYDCEKLYEALIQLGKYLAQIIRNNSKLRTELKNLQKDIIALEDEKELLPFLGEKTTSHYFEKIQAIEDRLQETKRKLNKSDCPKEYLSKLKIIKTKLDNCKINYIDDTKDRNIMVMFPKETQEIVQDICEELHYNHGNEVLRSVIKYLEIRYGGKSNK